MRIKSVFLPLSLGLGLLMAPNAQATQVSGRLAPVPADTALGLLGYSRTRVAMPSAEARARRADLAVFLKVRDSLPLPESTARWTVEITGSRLVPEVVSCAVDEVVEFTNRERRRVSLSINGVAVAVLDPGASAPYSCRDGGRAVIKLAEMPFAEGVLYVGESVGIAGRPDANGRFNLDAPKGTYELRVLGSWGVMATREVNIDRTDIDLGLVDIEVAAPSATPTAPTPPVANPVVPDPPSAAHDKVKATLTGVPAPKPPKLKLEKPEPEPAPPKEVAPSGKAKPALEPKPKPKAEPKVEAKTEPAPSPAPPTEKTEPKASEPRGSEEPAPAKLPSPKPKAEKKKAEDDFFELEP